MTRIDYRLRSEDLFSGLRPEKDISEDKKFKVARSDRLEAMIKGFDWTLIDMSSNYFYNKIFNEVGIYDSKEIEMFSVIIPDMGSKRDQFPMIGYYLSSLINKSKDKEFIIYTKCFPIQPSNIGNQNNGKTIIIHGNVGSNTGGGMTCGKIIINGNSGPLLGAGMSGGEIIINGNATRMIGEYMRGGKIVINGNSTNHIGMLMSGGEIHLNGDYDHMANTLNGDLYHNNRLLIKNGKKTLRYSLGKLLGWEK